MTNRFVLMFHGLGGDQNTMVPVGEYCSNHLPDTEFLCIPATINLADRKPPLLGWFEPPSDDDRAFDSSQRAQLEGITQSVKLIHAEIDRIIDQGHPSTSIHLLGHSQGGAIAIAAAMTYRVRLGSVHTIAGYIALPRSMEVRTHDSPFRLHHSDHDENVTPRWAEYAKWLLEKHAFRCTLRRWNLQHNPHGIHLQQLDAICEDIHNK